jgi:Molybdopterin cofactor-binding domain
MWSGLADIDGLSGKELAPPHESVGQSLLHCRKVGQPEGIEQIGHPWRQGVQDLLKIVSEIQQLAVALNIDPIELRLRNEPERDEFKNLPFSSRSTRECYRAAAERFGWNRRNPQPRSMRDGRWLIGWGMATATYPMNYAPASAMARLLPDGTAEVTSASSDMGAGHLDLHDAGCSRDARPADRAGEIHSCRYPAAASARARRLDDHGKRRQRRAGGLP